MLKLPRTTTTLCPRVLLSQLQHKLLLARTGGSMLDSEESIETAGSVCDEFWWEESEEKVGGQSR
jgi:hypothetical protein